MIFFPRQAGGAVLLRGENAVSLFSIQIPTHIYVNPNSYDIEALTMLVMILQLKGQAEGASFYTDNEALANQINKGHDTRSFPDNPVVSTIIQRSRKGYHGLLDPLAYREET